MQRKITKLSFRATTNKRFLPLPHINITLRYDSIAYLSMADTHIINYKHIIIVPAQQARRHDANRNDKCYSRGFLLVAYPVISTFLVCLHCTFHNAYA